MEITNAWKCEACKHIASEEDFRVKKNHLCPNCRSEDVFPYRLFRCKTCGHIAEQITWFPEWPADENPLELRVPAEQCENCLDTQDPEDPDIPDSADVELVPIPIPE